jgi:hypothetical protein
VGVEAGRTPETMPNMKRAFKSIFALRHAANPAVKVSIQSHNLDSGASSKQSYFANAVHCPLLEHVSLFPAQAQSAEIIGNSWVKSSLEIHLEWPRKSLVCAIWRVQLQCGTETNLWHAQSNLSRRREGKVGGHRYLSEQLQVVAYTLGFIVRGGGGHTCPNEGRVLFSH